MEKAIDGWVKYYNEKIFHESLDNFTHRDIYLGQGEKIKKIRDLIKKNSINKRFLTKKNYTISKINNYIRSCTLLLDNVQVNLVQNKKAYITLNADKVLLEM